MAEDGGLITPLWLLVGGTVEVSKNSANEVYMEVNAVNSYGVSVHIVYDGTTPTGVSDALSPQTQPVKYIKNSQLLIRKNGNEYNAQGIIVK